MGGVAVLVLALGVLAIGGVVWWGTSGEPNEVTGGGFDAITGRSYGYLVDDDQRGIVGPDDAEVEDLEARAHEEDIGGLS